MGAGTSDIRPSHQTPGTVGPQPLVDLDESACGYRDPGLVQVYPAVLSTRPAVMDEMGAECSPYFVLRGWTGHSRA